MTTACAGSGHVQPAAGAGDYPCNRGGEGRIILA